MSNCKYATIETTTGWSCNTCTENNPNIHNPEQDAINIPNARELNELYAAINVAESDGDMKFYPLAISKISTLRPRTLIQYLLKYHKRKPNFYDHVRQRLVFKAGSFL